MVRPSNALKRTALFFGSIFLIASALSAHALDFPTKRITLVVPYSPGTGIDLLARELAQPLSEKLGQPVVIENKAGAGGSIGTAAVARSEPDGHTLLFNTPSVTADQFIKTTPAVVVEKDLAPVALVIEGPYGVFVSASSPYNSLKDLIKAAKDNPGKLRYASTGVGGSSHLNAELLWARAGVKLTNVPYPGGPEMLTAIIQDNAQVQINVVPTMKSALEGKQLKLLAASAKVTDSPDVPTVAEAGVDGYAPAYWVGIFAPAKTPPEVVTFLNAQFNALLDQPAFKKRNIGLGYSVRPLSVKDFGDMVIRELKSAEQAAQAANIQKQ